MIDLVIVTLIFGISITSGIGTSYLIEKRSEDLEFCKNSQKHKVLKKYSIDITNKKCAVCNTSLVEENLSMIIPKDDELYFICNSDKCLTLKDISIGMK